MKCFRQSFLLGIFTLLASFDALQAMDDAPIYDEQNTEEFKEYLNSVVSTFRNTGLRPTNIEFLQEVQKRVKRRADPNVSNNLNDSRPIDFAAENADTDLITFLFEHGADMRANTSDNTSAIVWAARKGHIEASALLITLGAKTKNEALEQNLARYIGLPWNVRINMEFPEIEDLVKQGADLNISHGVTGLRAIHFAAERGDVDLIDYLFAHGADIQVQTKYKETPFFLAAISGHTEAVIRLLGLGAKGKFCKRAKDKTKDILSSYFSIESVLPGEPELHRAIRLKAGNNEIERVLADSPNSPSIDQLDIHGQTALSVALIKRDEDAILFLFSRGANPLLGIYKGLPLLARSKDGKSL